MPSGHASLRQFSIADCPDIVKAQIRLRRLTGRYSPGRVYQAMKEATVILNENFDRDATRAARRRLAFFFERELADRLPQSYRDAAAFPDIVTLATYLASDFWRRVSMRRNDPLYPELLRSLARLGIITSTHQLPRDLLLWTKIYGPGWPQPERFRMAWARLEADQNRMNL